jgi:hypothetical protein
MLLKQAQPTAQRARRRESIAVEHDPAALSASLRELAVRAHRLVRSADEQKLKAESQADPGILFNLERELSELHTELVYLERRLRAQDLASLVVYVAALRERIEEYLA